MQALPRGPVRRCNVSKVVLVCVVLATHALSACSTTRWLKVDQGEYVVVCAPDVPLSIDVHPIEKMTIARDEQLAVFTLDDGSQISTSFEPRDRAEWPAGCPTMVYSHRMEVLDIQEGKLTFDPFSFDHPILVRSCPPNPVRVFLREDGEFDDTGGPCAKRRDCVVFGPQRKRDWAAEDASISTQEDTPVTFGIKVSAKEEIRILDSTSFTVTLGTANGTLEIIGPSYEDIQQQDDGSYTIRVEDLVTYTPYPAFSGTDAFTYRICDMDGYWDTATVTLTVNPGTGP